MPAVTRLALYGGARPPYGSFAGKVEVIAVIEDARRGGDSRKKYKRKYDDDEDERILIDIAMLAIIYEIME